MPKDAIGILIDLARRGEIDPWDIDVVQLTDRFLHSLSRLDSADLPRSGQAIFYASVLVHMKAEILEGRMLEPSPLEADLDESDLTAAGLPGVALERLIRRRPAVPAIVERPLTLNDLIAHLREVEQIERRSARERPSERRTLIKGPPVRTMAEVEHLAHQEDLEALVSELWQVLTSRGVRAFEVLLEHYRDRVGAFLGLLFLAHRDRVVLEQAEFYRDIEIYAVNQPEDAPGGGALPQSPPAQP
ncbi:segregation/condensation protein A [Gloeobacter kilaueensis]|uniref:Segregation and condensation protein A n=1 Tax=Gloeobacter kilaueensis (strain ATCC BAA-2537 / CCAP 1431/1 / ULC 316 / JS1) TaxID=1183438 RepID=U5QI53_GLOK1|nr:ScpA family protein [Gloeobacter kilaueensis]AGY58568.1 segregation and condensation protein A [Gloeobacter kilaueensis JS1]